MNKNISGIIAGIIGGVIFLTFLLVLGLSILPSLIAGGAGFVISLFFFRPSQKIKPSADNSILVREMLASAGAQQAQMIKIARSLPAGNPRRKLEDLAILTGKIIADVRQDNPDYKAAGRFLNYYGDTAIRIATIYRDVASHGIDSPELRQMTAKVERNLDILSTAFKKHLVQLQENNFMDLDTELSVLESTLKMEGMDLGPSPDFSTSKKVERPWDKDDSQGSTQNGR